MMFGKNKGGKATAKRIPPDSVGAEVGVWRGDTAHHFLKRGLKHLHLVDPWDARAYLFTSEFGGYGEFLKRYSSLVGSADPEKYNEYYDNIFANVVNRFAGEPVTIHRMSSRDFWQHMRDKGERVDWVYLDGSHAYGEVFNDLVCAGQIARGSIFGDDYGNKSGVTQAVDDYVSRSGCFLEVYADNQYEISDAPF